MVCFEMGYGNNEPIISALSGNMYEEAKKGHSVVEQEDINALQKDVLHVVVEEK